MRLSMPRLLPLVLVLAVLAPAARRGLASVAGLGVALDDIVVVTEDLALNPAPGCDAVSVFSARTGEAVYRGERTVSPGRLAASADFSWVLANHSNVPAADAAGPFLYAIRGDPGNHAHWVPQGRIGGARFVARAGLALLPDGDTLLVSTAGEASTGTDLRPPFAVRKYRLFEMGATRLGPKRGEAEVDGPAVELFGTDDSRLVHVVTEQATVYSFEVAGMTAVADPIRLPSFDAAPPPAAGRHLNVAQASISPDGRYLVTNRWRGSEVGVADLVTRRAWTVGLGAGVATVGGLAFNHGPANHGLLAVHAGDAALVYDFALDVPRVARLAAAPVRPLPVFAGAEWGPAPSIAWSGDGRHLVAATSEGPAEFRVFAVEDGGRTLRPASALAACPDGQNRPNAILTANRRPVPPTPPSPTPIPTDTLTPTPTNTPVISPTPTDTPTLTSTPSPTPTRAVQPAYLPFLLLEKPCVPERLAVDVVMAIDTSLTMGQPTSSGRSKIEAARDAARRFLDRLVPAPGGNKASVVTFSATARLAQPLTDSRTALLRGLDGIVLAEGTCIGCGITAAHTELSSPRARLDHEPVMILLTDGRSNGEASDEAVRRAQVAHADGVRLFVIGLGDDVDRAVLVRIASERDYFYIAPDAEELAQIYQDIVQEIPCGPGR